MHCGVKLADAHLSDHVRVVTCHTARVDAKTDLSTSSLLNGVCHISDDVVPGGTLRREGAELYRLG
jgi:hypothetical protein